MSTDCMSKEMLRRRRFVVIAILLGIAATTGFLTSIRLPQSLSWCKDHPENSRNLPKNIKWKSQIRNDLIRLRRRVTLVC